MARSFNLRFAAAAVLCVLALGSIAPAYAQDKMSDSKMSDSKMSSGKSAKKEPKVLACQHCKSKYTLAEAKKHGNKCCGKALVKIKPPAKKDAAKKG